MRYQVGDFVKLRYDKFVYGIVVDLQPAHNEIMVNWLHKHNRPTCAYRFSHIEDYVINLSRTE